MRSFFYKLEKRVNKIDSRLCVGIDPHEYLIQKVKGENIKDKLIIWSKYIIDQTKKHAACYKINIAFFEMYGIKGLKALKIIIKYAKKIAPVILDAKRGDISSTAEAYAKACYKEWGVDSVTVSPYLGMESFAPFLKNKKSGVFLLCHTSNPSAEKIQRRVGKDGLPTYAWIASEASKNKQLGLVVGSTQSDIISNVRMKAKDAWLLCPGVGKQGGSLEKTVINSWGDCGNILISVSRTISESKNPKKKSEKIKNEINKYRDNKMFQTKNHKKLAIDLIKEKCILFGDFKLKSGLQSPIYIDLRKIVGIPKLYNLIVDIYKLHAEKINHDALLALPMSGLPIGCGVAIKMQKPLCYTRPPKKHGIKKNIEGGVEEDSLVLIIDDVTSKGTSVIESLETIRQKYIANDLLVLIDRDCGARKKLDEKYIKLHKIFSLKSLLVFWKKEGLITKKEYKDCFNFILENNDEL